MERLELNKKLTKSLKLSKIMVKEANRHINNATIIISEIIRIQSTPLELRKI